MSRGAMFHRPRAHRSRRRLFSPANAWWALPSDGGFPSSSCSLSSDSRVAFRAADWISNPCAVVGSPIWSVSWRMTPFMTRPARVRWSSTVSDWSRENGPRFLCLLPVRVSFTSPSLTVVRSQFDRMLTAYGYKYNLYFGHLVGMSINRASGRAPLSRHFLDYRINSPIC
jgi:hypothetical protein